MSMKLSLSSFAGLLRKSGLIESERIDKLLEDYRHRAGESASGTDFATLLVQQGELTLWQAKKLLQGKTRGFRLGKYRLLAQLGKGGMSTVYLAEHLVMRRQCAIKVLPSKQTRDPSALGRFHREAQAVAALDHPNIVRAYDVDHENEGGTEIHFLVMEFVEGANLQQIVDERGPLPVELATDYILQAARGLRHAHSAGLIHRDVKPTNVLVDGHGTVRLLDLGLARFFDESDQESLTIDHNQRVLGTADYLSPEQAVDSHRVDARADIYSLGCTFYYLLTGQPPFPEGTLAQRLLAHQTRRPTPVTQLRSDIPEPLVVVLERMMAKDPNARYPSADAVVEALEQLVATLPRPTQTHATHRVKSARQKATMGGGASSGVTASETIVASVEPQLADFIEGLDQPSKSPSELPGVMTAETVVSRQRPVMVPPAFPPEKESQHAVIDSGVLTDRSSSAALKRRAAESRRTTQLITLAAVSVATVLAAIGFLSRQRGESPRREGGGPANVAQQRPSTGPAIAATPAAGTPRPVPVAGEDLNVGATGHFGTIREALEYARDTHLPQNKTDALTIRVAGGTTYPEAIRIDNSQFGAFPRGVELICEDAEPAVLAPLGSEPAVELYGVERFRMKGFRIESLAPTAIQLSGYLVSLKLESLHVTGFTSLGLDGRGVTGFPNADRVQLREIEFRASTPSAVGMRFNAGTTPTKEIVISRCRFIGPMSAGIEFEDHITRAEIQECLFDDLRQGVSFGGKNAEISDILFRNNTFHRVQQGVVFATLPAPLSRDITFERNLFAGSPGAEAVVEAGQSDEWQGVFAETLEKSRLNWTERPESVDPQRGELDLFRHDGRRGVAVPFASVDPDQPDFLRPTLKDVRTAVSGDVKGLRVIGALAPKNGR